MPATDAIRVRDLARLNKAFALADKAVKEDLRHALEEAAQPVRAEAKRLALEEITNVVETRPGRSAWSDMRVGVERGGGLVYVAPVERGVKKRGPDPRRRPNLGNKLMDEAMAPALDNKKPEIEKRLEQMLDEVADVWERA